MKFLLPILLVFTISCSKTKQVVSDTANVVKDAGSAVVEKTGEAATAVADGASKAAKAVTGSNVVKLTNDSSIGFSIIKFKIGSAVTGKFNKFQGSAKYDGKNISNIMAAVFTNSIDTGDEKRDGHLKTGDFFDAAKHPVIGFKVDQAVTLAPSFDLAGELNMKGVKKDVVLKAKTISQDENGVVIEATGAINRSDFGITWNKDLEGGPKTVLGKLGKLILDDEVTLNIKIVAKK